MLFVVENNGYGLSTPAMEALAVADIANAGFGYGMPGVVVDGDDIFSVMREVDKAAAIEDPNPVLFFEHKFLYRSLRGEVPEDPYVLPLGRAVVALEGEDVTIVTYSVGRLCALEEAAAQKERGRSVEAVDLRTLIPLDMQTILTSVRKTNRVLVLHEAAATAGFGARENQLRGARLTGCAPHPNSCPGYTDPVFVESGGRDLLSEDQTARGTRGSAYLLNQIGRTRPSHSRPAMAT